MLRAAYLLLVLIFLPSLWFVLGAQEQKAKAFKVQLYLVLTAIVFLASRYCWRKVCEGWRDDGVGGRVVKGLTLTVSLGAQSCSLLSFFVLMNTEPHIITILTSLCLAYFIVFCASLMTLDVLCWLGDKCGWRGLLPCVSTRVVVAMVMGLLLVAHGYRNAVTPVIRRINIPIKNLPTALNGTTIVQLSDIHLGPTVGLKQFREVVTMANELNPDIMVITGDLVDGPRSVLREASEPLRDLKSEYGTYYVPGNHDYYTGEIGLWIERLQELGVHPLMNDRVLLPNAVDSSESFYLAGVEDYDTRLINYNTHGLDVKHALAGRDPGVPTIVLAHQPRAASEAIEWKDVHLVLCGHMHGGQMMPFTFSVYLFQPFFVGLYEPKPSVFVYVSPGTKYYLFPVRHWFYPEITLITIYN